jgi:hypothetical protein
MSRRTRTRRRRGWRVILFVAAGLGALILALVVFAVAQFNSESTLCFGLFDSPQAAERAAGRLRDAGFDADVDSAEERQSPEVGVTFYSGDTGDDAREFREASRQAVKREGGELGHPGGCLEKPFFD